MSDDSEEIIDMGSAQALETAIDDEEFGKYRTLVRVGRGGMAEVFVSIARGPAGFNKLVVIKRLHEGMAGDEAYREMFLEEARLAARLSHPNVVQTYEVSEHNGAIYLAMEYLEGQPLNRLVSGLAKRGQSVSHPLYVRIVCDVLAGLHYAHELRDFDGTPLRVVHRDVSPQNIFITYDGHVKVLDFGIAKAECSSTKTQAGVLKGKAGYMAPEQLMTDGIDRRVDVFTTGTVLWELLTGKRLMSSSSTAKTLVKLLNDPIPRVSEVVPAVDPELDAIVAKALQRKPEDRYSTALEMKEALEIYLSNIARTSGTATARYEDLGKMLSELFSEERAKLEREIRAQMSAVSMNPVSTGMMVARGADGEPASLTSSTLKLGTGSLQTRSSFMNVGVTRNPPPITRVSALDAPFDTKRVLMRRLAMAGAAVAILAATVTIFQSAQKSTTASASAATLDGSDRALGGAAPGEHTLPVATVVPTTPPAAADAPSAAPQPTTDPHAAPRVEARPQPAAAAPRRAPTPEPKAASAPAAKAPSAPVSAPNPPPPPAATPSDAPAKSAPPAAPAPAPNEGRRFRIAL